MHLVILKNLENINAEVIKMKISQTDFAQSLGISQKHMNKILNENANMSLDLMLAISLITDIDINLIMFIETKKRIGNELFQKYGTEKEINKLLNNYYINELKKLGWIKFKDIDNPVQKAMDLLNFLKGKNFDMLEKYQNERILYKKAQNADKTKILLWVRRCDELIQNQSLEHYSSSTFKELIKDLQKESLKPFCINNIQKLLNKHGIFLVVEDALKGTKIRGCMQVKGNNPVIYLTKLYKDKASFYFSLYHELGHVKSDYNEAKSKIIVEDIEKEEKADKFALDTMIEPRIWNRIIISDEETIQKISNREKIPMCFIVTRLAHEKYITYSSKFFNHHRELIK